MMGPPPLAASSLVIIWFANDRRLVVSVLVLFIFLVLVLIVVVGIARRHRVEDDGDDAPVDQTGSKIFGDVQGHVGSCWMSRHSQVDAIRVAVKNKPSASDAVSLQLPVTSRRRPPRLGAGG